MLRKYTKFIIVFAFLVGSLCFLAQPAHAAGCTITISPGPTWWERNFTVTWSGFSQDWHQLNFGHKNKNGSKAETGLFGDSGSGVTRPHGFDPGSYTVDFAGICSVSVTVLQTATETPLSASSSQWAEPDHGVRFNDLKDGWYFLSWKSGNTYQESSWKFQSKGGILNLVMQSGRRGEYALKKDGKVYCSFTVDINGVHKKNC